LTLLAGANSSDKSSLMQPVLLLKQTLEAPSDPGALLLNGPNVRFTSAEQLLSQFTGRTRGSEFAVRIDLSNGEGLEVRFNRKEGTGFEVNETIYLGEGETIRIVPDMPHSEITTALPPRIDPFKTIATSLYKHGWFWSVHRDRCLLSFRLDRLGSDLLRS
jgi:hypothetical protein